MYALSPLMKSADVFTWDTKDLDGYTTYILYSWPNDSCPTNFSVNVPIYRQFWDFKYLVHFSDL